jgi:hypothetical protein
VSWQSCQPSKASGCTLFEKEKHFFIILDRNTFFLKHISLFLQVTFSTRNANGITEGKLL